VQSRLRCDDAMLDALVALRAAGVPVALVTNALGRDCYDGFDLDALADVVVISSAVGVRKPSRRIYANACERLGVAPADCARRRLLFTAKLESELNFERICARA
jgi:putative hydrolase of the HAD superfamily